MASDFSKPDKVHTLFKNEIKDNILYFNPGSTIYPNDAKASFGVIEITEGNINSRIVSISN